MIEQEEETRINLNVPTSWVQQKRELGVTWKELMGRGILSLKDHPQLADRVRTLERKEMGLRELYKNVYNELLEIRKELLEEEGID